MSALPTRNDLQIDTSLDPHMGQGRQKRPVEDQSLPLALLTLCLLLPLV
jgi:hypothetical protein